jgi:hypothetical protein|tara:strand:+ start:4329 stop:4709 length:381 start_codon:yes stop_codon:yes gene_type:complete
MIWFKLNVKETLPIQINGSKALTTKITELLNTHYLLYTGNDAILENSIVADDRFWQEYEEWENDLVSENEEEEPLEVDGASVIVINTIEGEKVIQIATGEETAWYIKAQGWGIWDKENYEQEINEE